MIDAVCTMCTFRSSLCEPNKAMVPLLYRIPRCHKLSPGRYRSQVTVLTEENSRHESREGRKAWHTATFRVFVCLVGWRGALALFFFFARSDIAEATEWNGTVQAPKKKMLCLLERLLRRRWTWQGELFLISIKLPVLT